MDNIDIYINTLEKKHSLLKEIFEYISSKDLKNTKDEIEHITYYFEKRDKLYKKLLDIDTTLKGINIDKNNKKYDKSLQIIKQNDILIKNIIKEDKKQQVILNNILNIVKGNIKSIKNAKKADKNYFGIYDNYSRGGLFDNQR